MGKSVLLTLLGITLLCCSPATAQDQEVEECYHFTWIAEKNSTDCIEMNLQGIPCFEPFVVTGTGNGDMSNKFPPNITDLDETCKKMNCASYKCEKDGKQCIKWTEMDIKGQPTYISRFCGRIADVTKLEDPNAPNPPTITDECFVNLNGTVTIEACACDLKSCNGAGIGEIHLRMLLLSVAAVGVVTRWFNVQ